MQVIFDFDGTITSKDTGYAFYRWLLLSSPLRSLIFVILLPFFVCLRILAFFFNSAWIKKFGLNIVCIIATIFRKDQISQLIDDFLTVHMSKNFHYRGAVEQLKQHIKNGDSVVIVSGCPNVLLHKILDHFGIRNIEAIGSDMKLSSMGYLIKVHCYERNKIKKYFFKRLPG